MKCAKLETNTKSMKTIHQIQDPLLPIILITNSIFSKPSFSQTHKSHHFTLAPLPLQEKHKSGDIIWTGGQPPRPDPPAL